jgi:hypothetical protein
VDEYVLTLHPVALGSGKRIFIGPTGPTATSQAGNRWRAVGH